MASTPLPNAAGFVLANVPSFGALVIGTPISMILLGIAILQVWNYYREFGDDPRFVKTLVAVVFLADVLHSVLFVHLMYHYTITGFVRVLTEGDPSALVVTPWSLQAAVTVFAIQAALVQSYFSIRVLRITESRLLALVCWIPALVRMCIGFAVTATAIQHATIAVVTSYVFEWENIVSLSFGVFSDIAVASCICVGLLRRRTGFSHSDRLIDRLVIYTVGSGLATSVVSALELIFYLTMPTTYVWIVFFGLISKVFSNSLLASLNQRGTHRLVSLTSQQRKTGGSTRVNFNKDTVEMSSMDAARDKPVLHIGANDGDVEC